MKAVIAARYGPPGVLQLRKVEKPAPGSHEILVRVRATTVTAGDCRMRSFTVPPALWLPARMALGFFRPRRPVYGTELAGDVEAIGPGVTRFTPGDPVFASTLTEGFGAHAGYKCLSEYGMVARKPANASYEEAAAMPTGATAAVRLLRKGGIKAGQKILIYGASGSVGTYAVQIARHLGADVTGVCSTANLEMVKSLGAYRVLDYTREDLSSREERYDVIFDAVGKTRWPAISRALASGGIYVTIAGLKSKESIDDLEFIRELMEAGRIKAVIDRCYPLEHIVAAHQYVDAGHKRGNVVIIVE
jgi:NADPH:quinone reductase-like Zn-dependent oxidoreductase